MPALPPMSVNKIGSYIREQRSAAEVSLRQLAKVAGISNPYLSQIERGLRKPSAEILQQIAKGLRISAETLYVQAGILEDRGGNGDLIGAIRLDASISDRQKQVLLDIYESFCRENQALAAAAVPAATASPAGTPTARPARARRTAAGRRPATSRPKRATSHHDRNEE